MPHRTPPPAETAAALGAHRALVAQLRRPGACGGQPEAAELIETHISSLLLVDGQVYKLKKPVALGFVDFSTLALRRDACEQELRLNRRTAPRWYVDVLPVRQGVGGATIAAPHDSTAAGSAVSEWPVLDWAVHMHRFDDRQRLDRLALAGLLTPQQVDHLAAVVARFHTHLDPAPPGYGRSALTRHWARENLVELAALVADARGTLAVEPAAADAVAALQRWTEARGAALAGLMDLRCRTGHVREVHGDLHLGNVVWIGGAPVLFDALEFNDTLRHIDTVGDLAFTFMDLHAHGLPRLAWRFISTALEASGDQAALPLLAWWAVYRAAVRAKVALLGAVGQSRDDLRAQALAQFQHYLDVATGLARPAECAAATEPAKTKPAARPRLVLTCGLSGSGKSTVAGALAERLGALRVRSDVERKRLFALPPTAPAAPGLYDSEATRRTYERLQELAALALRAGVSVVVDAASLKRSERDAMRALADQHRAAFTLLLCEAPPAVLLARVQARRAEGGDASDATPEVLALQQAVAEWPGADEAADTLRLATDVAWPLLAQQVEALRLAM